jgi:hypothetical protein
MTHGLREVAFTDEDRKSFFARVASITASALGVTNGPSAFGELVSIGAVMNESGQKFALVPLDGPAAPTEIVRDRYRELARLRRLEQISDEQLVELRGLEDQIRNEQPPPEYAFAIQTIAEDRRALRDSMNRIEELLRNRE